jgi:ferrochelatase
MEIDEKGVILLNLGGPDSLEAVKPFLYNLFSDRDIIRLGPRVIQKPLAWIIASMRASKTKDNYSLIGGSSPILDITIAQAKKLEENLKSGGKQIRTYVGMRYWGPSIGEAVERALNDGLKELIVLPLFPQYSSATTGSCFKEMKRNINPHRKKLRVNFIESWQTHPLYIEAIAQTIREGLRNFEGDKGQDVLILFSAHSLPQKVIDEGDPYVDQINSTVNSVVKKLKIKSWKLSFQSRSGPVRWIGPETNDTIDSVSKEGVKKILMVPISFVSDHIETLYEMDILYKKQAEKLGVILLRAPSLNTSTKFIEALADIVKNKI